MRRMHHRRRGARHVGLRRSAAIAVPFSLGGAIATRRLRRLRPSPVAFASSTSPIAASARWPAALIATLAAAGVARTLLLARALRALVLLLRTPLRAGRAARFSTSVLVATRFAPVGRAARLLLGPASASASTASAASTAIASTSASRGRSSARGRPRFAHARPRIFGIEER